MGLEFIETGFDRPETEEVIDERPWNDLRLVIAHDPMTAADQTAKRNARIEALITQGDQWTGKLDDQDDGKKHRGRKLSDSGAKARFYHAVCEAHLSRIIQVDMAAQQFSYDIDEGARTLAERMDGKLLLVTDGQELPLSIFSRTPCHQLGHGLAFSEDDDFLALDGQPHLVGQSCLGVGEIHGTHGMTPLVSTCVGEVTERPSKCRILHILLDGL